MVVKMAMVKLYLDNAEMTWMAIPPKIYQTFEAQSIPTTL